MKLLGPLGPMPIQKKKLAQIMEKFSVGIFFLVATHD
jgi:hypothetical protein